ncbi:FAD-binding dehydrogenase [Sinimarinibacterium sp. CAU 1509]|uniref:FAD-binding dehydrogenase n=1 Tax=Sinimarinibacterium sp. CAU 1509 TaxID=2562283 RepID=UPI0010AC6C5A|nr:FAD-binding dehydrogenase [Sinimarinibacterium sp. CAU 1509]TJY56207.1 FAD-binding dehydrogenase [Sinimarinibacterium sp. CAU 1509]
MRYRTETAIIGGGLAGVVTALELLDRNRNVLLLERGGADGVGGLANEAFGGVHLVDTPLQRLQGVRDSRTLALADWHSFAEFDADDHWPRQWAEYYVERCRPDVYDWLRRYGVSFFPAVQWVERGWYRPGNSVPRYHVVWGTARHLTQVLVAALREHPQRNRLQVLCGHTVHELTYHGRAVTGCAGETADGGAFAVDAEHIVVASGGITGNLARVRANWPRDWGAAPDMLLNGSHPEADGAMHDAVAALGGRVTHLDQMWNYAAGVRHPRPRFDGHGLSLIPCKSALWMDHRGVRIGPEPLVTGFDTRHLVQRVAALEKPYSWQVLNWRIAARELAVSGAEHNPDIRDRRFMSFLVNILSGNPRLIRQMVMECADFVTAKSVSELAEKMNQLAGSSDVDAGVLEAEIRRYDDNISRGPRFHNDDQLRRIAQLRRWLGDRVRTCRFQRILDPAALPLIAVRLRVVTRKTLGGIQTDLGGRVLDAFGMPLQGLYAVGESAGFGGGGSSGKRSMEGTCLSGCILTGQAAAAAIAAGTPAAIQSRAPKPVVRDVEGVST